jgi:hypothetical protein
LNRYYWHYSPSFLMPGCEKRSLNQQLLQRICYEIHQNSAGYQHPHYSTSGMAMDKTAAGAVAGAAIGAAAGKDLKSTVGGAVVGAGTGAMFKNGEKGKDARKGGAVGAVVGAGTAAVTGNSVLKGAAVGAGAGALIGEATH